MESDPMTTLRSTGDETRGPRDVDVYVGERVVVARLRLGQTQTELGQAIGVTFQQIQKYERGLNRISVSRLWAIAAHFQVDVGFFFEGYSEPNANAQGASARRHDLRATRQTREIARLAEQLTPPRQTLALEVVRALVGDEELGSRSRGSGV